MSISNTKSLLKCLFPQMYRRASAWRAVRRNIAELRKGHRLVPEEALEAKYREAIELLVSRASSKSELGDYLEFGVYSGSSLACMYRALRQTGCDHVRLIGFDSFEGLPPEAAKDDGGFWRPGQFRMNYRFARKCLAAQGVDLNRVILVKGWFKDTLNSGLVRKHTIKKASLIMVDCDMYLSAKAALDFCAPLIQDQAVLFFDDWFSAGLDERNMGEKRAFDEFLRDHPELVAEDFGAYNNTSNVVVVTQR